jgi:hypothetical protein
MPTRYRPTSWRRRDGWVAIWDPMYQALEPKAVRILRPTGFYEKYDLEIPGSFANRRPIGEEKAAIEAIATALAVAADCAHKTPPGVGQPGCGSSQRNLHCSEARTCRPKYIGKSCRATGESLSGRERIPRTCCGGGAGSTSTRTHSAQPTSISAGPQGWPRELYGSLAVVREITAIRYWPKTLGERSVPWADALLAARPRKTRWEEGYDTSKMARSIISSRK